MVDSQYIGNNFFDPNYSMAGGAKFSPDGTKYANYNIVDGLNLFDFDRTTGKLSNYRHIDKYYDLSIPTFYI